MRLALAALLVGGFVAPSLSMWKPEYAQMEPRLRQWYSEQKNPKTRVPCCSDSDGAKAIEDIRYDDQGVGHYWVSFTASMRQGDETILEKESGWMQVPDEAVINEVPNLAGVPVVWWATQNGNLFIRCFVPGPKA